MPVNPDARKQAYARIKKMLSGMGLDALLVSAGNDVIYLTGFSPTPPAMLLIPRKGTPAYLIDPMNGALAGKMIRGLGGHEKVLVEKDTYGALASLINKSNIRKLGINENSLSARAYRMLTGAIKRLRPEDASSLMGELRELKDRREISLIRKAARETVKIWKEFTPGIRTGMTEIQMRAALESIICARGYTCSFPPIVATGKNTAYPHACPTSRRLHRGEHVLVDFGIRVSNYCSDLTRTWDNGRINRQLRDLRRSVLEARDRALKDIRDGVNAGAPASKVNKYFEDIGFKRFVRHSLGHGIGLSVHESPFLRETSPEKLKKNMVVTVEPGLYSEGMGGMREEDMVLVKDKGCEVLTV